MFFLCLAELLRDGNMQPELTLSSVHNPRIKQILLLRDRREREASGLFLIEGYRELLRAADAGWKIESLYICPSLFLGSNEESLIKRIRATGGKLIACTDRLFHKISYRDRPDGLLAVAMQRHLKLQDLNAALQAEPFPLLIV